MACIDDMFDSILEIIFRMLPLHFRLKCKEVCCRWHKLLMTREIFREDRHIYMRNCLIEPSRPPMSVFMKTKYPYQILSLGLSFDLTYVDWNETLPFWRHLNKTVTEIHFHCKRKDLCEIFYEMTNVETVIFKYDWFEMIKELVRLKEENTQTLFPNLKRFEASTICMMLSDEDLDDYKLLTKVISSNVEIKFKNLHISEDLTNSELFEVFGRVTSDCLYFDAKDDLEDYVESLTEDDDLPFEKMRIEFEEDEIVPFDVLENFFEKHSKINDTCLNMPMSIIPFTFVQITELNFLGEEDPLPIPPSLKFLEKLPNLETFWTKTKHKGCLFGHETINLPKLKCYDARNAYMTCEACLTALASSFPRMENFTGYIGYHDDHRILALMFQNWPLLEYMKVEFDGNIRFIGKSVENLIKPLYFFKTFRMLSNCNAPRYNGNEFEKMSKFFPQLNELNIDLAKGTDDVDLILEDMLRGFKELTILTISNNCRVDKPLSRETEDTILKCLLENGKSLRTCYLPQVNVYLDTLNDLFTKLDQLCYFNTYKREEWVSYEAHKSRSERKRKISETESDSDTEPWTESESSSEPDYECEQSYETPWDCPF